MHLAILAGLAVMSLAPLAAAKETDPYLWLEDVSSPRAMAWVEAHNAASTKVLKADPRYNTLYDEAFAIAAAKDRIPNPRFLDGAIYNFWQDGEHLRGIWRKTTLADYPSADPRWTIVLDIDALGKAENRSWVFKGANCLRPDERLCLIYLSDGGEDAIEAREFDLASGRFVDGGFHLPGGKQSIAWQDADHLLVSREWAPGELTASGYPYVVKRLARGQPLSAAVEVYRGEASDTEVSPSVYMDGENHTLTLITRALDTFRSEHFVVGDKGVAPLAVPEKTDVADLVAGRVVFSLHEPWTVAGRTFPAGAVVAADLAAVKADPAHLRPSLVWAPGPREALDDIASTRDKLLLATLDNVRGRAFVFSPAATGARDRRQLDLPDNLAIGFGSTDRRSNRAFVGVTGFLTPSSVWLADAASSALNVAKSEPAKFDAAPDVIEQWEATSSDGARIPYFVVHRRDIALDGSTPTLLSAYGGFEVSMTPYYSATVGKLWLERGGAFVLANIRGGGEFGPAWHEAAVGVKRQVAYDDFAAVARDLIARKITSPRRLGIEGGSNGGLLMGVEMVQHPELWRAVVIEVPLLDMLRISDIAAGASWEGEYGDVAKDPAVRAFWLKTSPYQNLKIGVAYPEPFIFTTTKDDRVGPQHARKFAARMEAMGLPFYYYENTEGGHAAGADLKQAARTTALTMTYLARKLID